MSVQNKKLLTGLITNMFYLLYEDEVLFIKERPFLSRVEEDLGKDFTKERRVLEKKTKQAAKALSELIDRLFIEEKHKQLQIGS